MDIRDKDPSFGIVCTNCMLTHNYAHTEVLQREEATLSCHFSVFAYLWREKKRSICTLHISDCRPSNPIKTLLKAFKAISLDIAQREGVVPASHNILHCHPEQLFPFFLALSGLSSYYTGRKKGGTGRQSRSSRTDREMQYSLFSSEMTQTHQIHYVRKFRE